MNSLIDIYTELKTNPKFRDDFKKNVDQALKNAGFILSEDDIKKIKANTKLFEELEKRINK